MCAWAFQTLRRISEKKGRERESKIVTYKWNCRTPATRSLRRSCGPPPAPSRRSRVPCRASDEQTATHFPERRTGRGNSGRQHPLPGKSEKRRRRRAAAVSHSARPDGTSNSMGHVCWVVLQWVHLGSCLLSGPSLSPPKGPFLPPRPRPPLRQSGNRNASENRLQAIPHSHNKQTSKHRVINHRLLRILPMLFPISGRRENEQCVSVDGCGVFRVS